MKSILKAGLIALVLMLGVNASAQTSPIKFGVKGGVNLSNYSGDVEGTSAKVGYNVGFTVDLALLSNLYLASGLEFTTKGAKLSYEMIDDVEFTGKVEATMNAMYLQLPVHLGYKIDALPGMKILVHAGPYVAYGIGGKTKLGDNITVTNTDGISVTMPISKLEELANMEFDKESNTFGKDGLKEFDFGLGFGVGAEFGKIGVNLGYDLGLANVVRDSDISVKNMNAHLSVGYKF